MSLPQNPECSQCNIVPKAVVCISVQFEVVRLGGLALHVRLDVELSCQAVSQLNGQLGPTSALTPDAAPGRNLDLNTPVERIDLHGQKVQEAHDMLVDLLGPHIKYRHKRASLCRVAPAKHNIPTFIHRNCVPFIDLEVERFIYLLLCLHGRITYGHATQSLIVCCHAVQLWWRSSRGAGCTRRTARPASGQW